MPPAPGSVYPRRMTISMHELATATFVGGLRSHKHHLSRAVAHAGEHRIEPRALLGARLYPDMFDLTRQSQTLTDIARRAMDRLAGDAPSSVKDEEQSFEELVARVDATIAHVQAIGPDRLEGSEERKITLEIGQTMTFSGRQYLVGFTLPNFLFHVTTAYDILRHNGVVLGKRDLLASFLG